MGQCALLDQYPKNNAELTFVFVMFESGTRRIDKLMANLFSVPKKEFKRFLCLCCCKSYFHPKAMAVLTLNDSAFSCNKAGRPGIQRNSDDTSQELCCTVSFTCRNPMQKRLLPEKHSDIDSKSSIRNYCNVHKIILPDNKAVQ